MTFNSTLYHTPLCFGSFNKFKKIVAVELWVCGQLEVQRRVVHISTAFFLLKGIEIKISILFKHILALFHELHNTTAWPPQKTLIKGREAIIL